MSTTRKQTKGFLLGALAGGIIGSVTALLLAPKAGKELREDISAGAQKVGDATVKAVCQVGETTGKVAKQIGEQAVDLADRAKQAGIDVAETVKSWRGKGGSEEDALATVSSHEARQKELELAFAEAGSNDEADPIRS